MAKIGINTDCVVKSAREFISFVSKSLTPFHVVANVSEMLKGAGYQQLEEHVTWPCLEQGGKYFVVRNETSIVAFSLGKKFSAENGLKIAGAHTDSPNLALKPRTKKTSSGYGEVAVQCYGGGLWHTWFDRDLTVAGRIIVSEKNGDKKALKSHLVSIPRPILRIPTLAIHLTSGTERTAFSPNNEKHLVPVITTAIAEALDETQKEEKETSKAAPTNQCGALMELVGKFAGVSEADIVDFDLSVVDTQPATLGGAREEFIFSARLDNLISCFCAVKALIESDADMENETMGRVVCLFDHEEIGSSSSQGAGGTLIADIVEHILKDSGVLRATLVANSFLLSVDGAHGVHPNYSDKHEEAHRPNLHLGPVIKYNANVKYATNGYTAAVVKTLADHVGVPIQEFVVKNDSPCGSTIGPILSTLSGIKCADIGNPMLSMHSIREMCGTLDIYYMTSLLKSFFENYQ